MECFQRHLSKNNIPDFRGAEMRQKTKLALSAREKNSWGRSYRREWVDDGANVEGLGDRKRGEE